MGASSRGYSSAPFRAGEELRYKIKLGFLRLGTLELTQARADSGGALRYVVTMSAEKARHVPFVSMNWTNRAWLDPRNPTNWVFVHEEAADPPTRLVYRSDSSATVLGIAETGIPGGPRRARLEHPSPLFDAVGLLMLIRGLCASDSELDVPTIVAQQARLTHLQFTGETQTMDVNGMPSPVRVRRFIGQSSYNCQSCGGLTGRFEGWLTDDEAAIPVRMSMKIAAGSIKILLESIERPAGEGASAAAAAGPPGSAGGGR